MALLGVLLIFGEGLEILDSPPSSTTVLLYLIVAVAFLSTTQPDLIFGIVKRLQHIEAGGVQIAFQSQLATESLTRSLGAGTSLDDDDSSVRDFDPSLSLHSDLRRIKRELNKRIRFVGVVVFEMPHNPNEEAVMRQIQDSNVLSAEEISVIAAIRTMNVGDFSGLQTDERLDRLERIWRVANRFASSYWDAYVRDVLKRSGFGLFDFEQSNNHRRDFLVRTDDRKVIVAARVEVLESNDSPTVNRWGKELDDIRAGATGALAVFSESERVILVPDHGDTARAAKKRELAMTPNFLGVIKLSEFVYSLVPAADADADAGHTDQDDAATKAGRMATAAAARGSASESKRSAASASGRAEPRRRKQLIVCCDGTWNVPDNDKPTNVGRIAELAAAKADGETDVPERVVYYVRGVGGRYKLDKLIGGGLGSGLHVNIRDAYAFIAQNYLPGDEIYLFGFSRGATTVRCVAGMIAKAGLLKPDAIHKLNDAYKIYRDDQRRTRGAKPLPLLEGFVTEFKPPIQFLGVFDTVGALGVPIRVFDRSVKFRNQKLCDIVVRARQALALNERRWTFKATVWEDSPGLNRSDFDPEYGAMLKAQSGIQRIQQKWFVGCHSDIGGGYRFDSDRDKGLSNLGSLTLEWMLQEARAAGFTYSDKAKKRIFERPGLSLSQGATYEVHNSMNPGYLVLGAIDWISQIVLHGGFSIRARRVLTSGAVGQSVHESVWKMYFCDPKNLNQTEFALASNWPAGLSPARIRHRTTIPPGKKHPFRVRRHRDLQKIVDQVSTSEATGLARPYACLSKELEMRSFRPHWPMNLTSKAARFFFYSIRDIGRWVIGLFSGRAWKRIIKLGAAGTVVIVWFVYQWWPVTHLTVAVLGALASAAALTYLTYSFVINRNYL